MNEHEKKAYLEKYQQEKAKGVPFFPDAVFKDALVSLVILAILVALAYFLGAPLEERANPADTSYTPRPEWYFLFLFQLLKYFPGRLEVIGAFVIPTLVIILLLLLPFLDRSRARHFANRPAVTAVGLLGIGAIIWLSVLSVREAPPPAEAAEGDEVAALYANNCAGCHGPTINVPANANLHEVIAQGSHEGMPVWSGDLSSDEIDALAGFIVSPQGSQLFVESCGACHAAGELVGIDPIELRLALEQGPAYPPHGEVEVPPWDEVFSREERAAMMNFLVAPDGQRLFATNCAGCHGRSVAFVGDEVELEQIIRDGGMHLDMPAWGDRLSEQQIERLALYVVKPSPSGQELYDENCARCHSDRVPQADNYRQAKEIITLGGPHETMPVWGDALTDEQMTALVAYTYSAAQGAPVDLGQQLFADNCADCHGDFGEGGENPSRPNDIIAPISTSEYLRTRDDATLRAIIAQGQPNFGMSPFGSAFGGPLENDEIDAIVDFMRSWEANPPVELPPDIPANTLALSSSEIFLDVCSQCHGLAGEGLTGPSLRAADFRASNTPQDIYDSINLGHPATQMIAWGSILSAAQIEELATYILSLPILEATPTPEAQPTAAPGQATPTPGAPAGISFEVNVRPIFEARCLDCHGTDGGWDAATYELVMTSGDHAPVIVPGDPEASLLAQKLLGTHAEGDIMPPPPLRPLPEAQIGVILEWILAGAPE